jgi:hypothetical protein
MTLALDPTHVDLATLSLLWQGEAASLDDAAQGLDLPMISQL